MNRRASEQPDTFKESDLLLTTIFRASHLGIAIHDKQLRFQAVNEAFASMNGVPVEEHYGQTIRKILGPVASELEPILERVFTTGESTAYEFAAQLPARTEICHRSSRYFPVKSADGSVTQVCALMTDLTERKRLESSLFGLSRKMLCLHAALKANTEELSGVNRSPIPITERLAQMAKQLDFCISEIVYISHLPDSPLPEITPEVLGEHNSFFSSIASKSLRINGKSPVSCLSEREREVVCLLAEGNANKEAAAALGISVRTVEAHRAKIMFKLGLHSISELVLYAVRSGIVHP